MNDATTVSELQRVNADLENLLVSTQIAMIQLDTNFRIRRYTPAALRFYDLSPSDTGRRLAEVGCNVSELPTIDDFTSREIDNVLEHTFTTSTNSTYILRLAPFIGLDGSKAGSVLTFTDITVRSRMMSELADREQQLGSLISSTAEGIYGIDIEGVCTFANEACARLLGYDKPEDLLDRDMHQLAHHTRRDGSNYPVSECKVYQAYRQCHRIHVDDEIFWRRDGTSFDVQYWSYPIIRDGKVKGCVVTFLDITERKKWERELEGREAHLRRVIDNTLSFIGVLSTDGTLLEANRTAIAAGGLERDDVIGKKFWDCYWWNFDDAGISQLQFAIQQAASGQQVRYDAQVRMAGDARICIDFMLSPVKNDRGEVTQLIPSGVDISARKQAEEAILQREKYLNLALRSGKMGSWEWSIHDDEVTWSDYLYDMYGCAPKEFDGTLEGFVGMVVPEDRDHVSTLISESLQSGSSEYTIECRVRRINDNQVIWTRGHGLITRDENGSAIGITGLAIDITQDKNRVLNLAFLSELDDTLSACTTAEDIAMVVTAQTAEHLDLSGCSLISIAAELGDQQYLGGCQRNESGSPDGSRHMELAFTREGLTRLHGNRTLMVDTGIESDLRTLLIKAPAKNTQDLIACVGINSQEKLRLVLAASRSVPSLWQEDALQFLQDLAARVFTRLERSRAEEALRSSESELRLGIDVSRFALAHIDYLTDTVRLSAEASRLYGLGADELSVSRDTLHATFHPDDREEIMLGIESFLHCDRGDEFSREHRILLPNGDIRWVFVQKKIFLDESEQSQLPVRSILAVQDITKRKLTEQSMRDRERQLNIALEAGNLGTWYWDIPEQTITMSDRMRDLFDISEEQFDGRPESLLTLVHPKDRAGVKRSIMRELASNSVRHAVEFRILHDDGGVIWSQSLGIIHRDDLGNPRGITGVSTDTTKRKNAELELAGREAHLRRVINNQLGLVGVIDSEGVLLEIDDRFLTIAGLQRSDVIGKTFADCAWWTYEASVQAQIRAAVERAFNGETVRFDVEVFATGRNRQMIDFMIAPVLDDQGDIAYLIPSGIDISERKRAEAELAESRQRLTLAMESAHMGTFEWMPATDWAQFDNGLIAITGLDPAKAETGTEFFDLIHAEDKERIRRMTEGAIAGDCDYATEYRIVKADSQVRWLATRGTFIQNRDSDAGRLVALHWDITDDKQVADALRMGEARLQRIIEGATVGIAFARPDGEIYRANEAALQILGFTAETFSDVRHNWADMLVRDSGNLVESRITSLRESGVMVPTEAHVQRWDGSQVTAMVSALSVDEQHEEHVLFFIDQTQQKRYEETLEGARQMAESANKSKTEFLANMSHEIRTPMTAIIGYVDILLRRTVDPDDVNCLSIIRRNGHYLLEIINDILDISKVEAGKLELIKESFSANQLIADVQSLMNARAEEKGIHMRVEYQGKLPKEIYSDQKRFKQILVNLIGNAIKFTEVGEVKLRVRFKNDDTTPVVICEVEDTGIGMTPEHMSQLFNPFSQADSSLHRQYGGTGLGLAISQRIAQMLGGKIDVESEIGTGSQFTLTIATGTSRSVEMIVPLDIPEFEPDSFTELEADVSLHGRFLVVDDRREIRFIAQQYIEDAGGLVVSAENGQEAIDKVIDADAQGVAFDMLVMDMQMPILDGYEATRRLRQRGYLMPIIALTAHAMQGDREKCMDAGCTDYLAKPLEGTSFIATLAKYLGNGRAESEARPISILIIDDGVDAVTALSRLLEFDGHEIHIAHNGAEGIEAAQLLLPDVVLLDLGLPDISGFEVLKCLQEQSSMAGTMFIAMTGQDTPAELVAAGFDKHLLKPVDLSILRKMIEH